MEVKETHGLNTASEVLGAALARQRKHRSESRDLDAGEATTSPPGADHVEELLATIFAGVLGVATVRRDLAFSELGGESLMATRVLSRVWRTFDVKLPLSAMAPETSVGGLTESVKRARNAGMRSEPPLRARASSGAEELSPNQAAIWFLESLRDPGPLYNIPYGLRLSGQLDVPALRRSLDRLIQRHEALRLRFEVQEGRLLQTICIESQAFQLPLVDISGMPRAARESHALSLTSEHIRVPFDLTRPPLLRALLIRLAPEDHMLVLSIHHIVCDAWSIGLMMQQLGDYYAGGDGEASYGATPGFLDFVAWQRATLDDAEVTRIASDWRVVLGDVSDIAPAPIDHPRAGGSSDAGAIEPIELSAALVADLRRLSGDHGVTLYMTLLSAFAAVLSRGSATGRVILGVPAANRGQKSLEEIVGYLANMLPICVDCGGDPTMRELLRRVRSMALAAYDRQTLPFAQLVQELRPPRRSNFNPVFQSALVLNDISIPVLKDVEVSPVLLHTGTAKLDLTCYLEGYRGGLHGYLEYATERFSPERMKHLRRALEKAISQIPDYADLPLSELISLPSWDSGRTCDGNV